jgi:hypothetical protein
MTATVRSRSTTAPWQAIVTKLESFPIDGGVQLKWALGNVRGVFQSISLERSDNETGPWALR